jgi:hypothetical protein
LIAVFSNSGLSLKRPESTRRSESIRCGAEQYIGGVRTVDENFFRTSCAAARQAEGKARGEPVGNGGTV